MEKSSSCAGTGRLARRQTGPTGRPLVGLSDAVLRRIDASRTLALAAETNEHVAALDDAVFSRTTPREAVAGVHAHWEVYPFEPETGLVAVHSAHGWGCQPSAGVLDAQWPRLPVARRRNVLRTVLIEQSMVFTSLSAWAQALLEVGPSALHAGVWRVLGQRLDAEEFTAVQFLYGLGGIEALRTTQS